MRCPAEAKIRSQAKFSFEAKLLPKEKVLKLSKETEAHQLQPRFFFLGNCRLCCPSLIFNQQRNDTTHCSKSDSM